MVLFKALRIRRSTCGLLVFGFSLGMFISHQLHPNTQANGMVYRYTPSDLHISDKKTQGSIAKPFPSTLNTPENTLVQQRFAKWLQKWPKNKPKAAVYYLMGTRHNNNNKSLTLLNKFFIATYKYPVILFHEKNFDLTKLRKKYQILSLDMMFFQQVKFKVPAFSRGHVREKVPCVRDLGYRHMCRFQAKGFSDEPIMQGLDYVWRLDDDSFLLGNLTYDPFKYMRDHNLLYGYNTIHDFQSSCVVDLWRAVDVYVGIKNITRQTASWPEPQEYYNNFEISAMSFWWSKDYVDYFDYIDRWGGIYWHRWGDAPIKSLAVSIFVPENQRRNFKDIPYQHKAVKYLPKPKV